MGNHRKLIVMIWLLGFFLATGVIADPDLEREKLIADKLTEELRAGEAIWLGESNAKFLGLFTETFLQQRNDAVLLLHGMGAHPDWPYVISPLRWEFPAYRLPVLSIQLPILSPDASVSGYGKTTKEAARRIKIAVDYLHEQGFKRVMLVGYSFGAAMGAYYLANGKDHDVYAFIAISILARKFLDPTLNLKFLLEKIDIPMLDIYGSNDLEEILKAVPDRRLAAHKSGNAAFKQIEISGSDHIYREHTVDLVNVIVDWIAQHPHSINEDIGNANQPYHDQEIDAVIQ